MQRTVWRKIADTFHKKGYYITEEQCNVKWRNLKRRYKNVRDLNNRTGRGTEQWEYFDVIEEFIHTRPEIAPLSIISSTHGFRTQSSPHFEQIENSDENNSAAINTSGNMKRNIRKRRRNSEWAQKLYEQKEAHHKENIGMQERFLTLFEQQMQKNKE